jgi:adenosine/AMP kinase
LNLVISNTKGQNLLIVAQDFFLEIDDAWIVLVFVVAQDKAAIKFNNARERQLGAFGVV